MAKIEINRLTNANVYVDGNSFLGRAEEIQLPQIKHKMAEHKALGMAGSSEFFSGIEKMECKIKWASLYPDVMKKASNPFKTVQLQARASLETYSGQGRTKEVPVVVYLTGAFREFPLGNFKQHDNAEFETSLSVYYAKLVVDGTEIFEIDVIENIYKVDGVDVLETYRTNIGG
jgi:P2 family phage contractile tail tube protein